LKKFYILLLVLALSCLGLTIRLMTEWAWEQPTSPVLLKTTALTTALQDAMLTDGTISDLNTSGFKLQELSPTIIDIHYISLSEDLEVATGDKSGEMLFVYECRSLEEYLDILDELRAGAFNELPGFLNLSEDTDYGLYFLSAKNLLVLYMVPKNAAGEELSQSLNNLQQVLLRDVNKAKNQTWTGSGATWSLRLESMYFKHDWAKEDGSIVEESYTALWPKLRYNGLLATGETVPIRVEVQSGLGMINEEFTYDPTLVDSDNYQLLGTFNFTESFDIYAACVVKVTWGEESEIFQLMGLLPESGSLPEP
jgi:hypothetical protein